MNKQTIYKVLTLKELIEQVYSHNCGYERPTSDINHDVALYLYNKTSESYANKHEFKFGSQKEATSYYNSLKDYKFVVSQVYDSIHDMFEIVVSDSGKIEFKFINKTAIW